MSQQMQAVPKKRGRKPKNVVEKIPDVMEMLKESCKEPEVVNHTLLNHLGNYLQEPFDILQSYFEGKPLERLVRHQLESYNNFVNYQMQRTIEMFNPITIKSDADYNVENDTYGLIVKISLKDVRFQHPQIHENNGAMKTMMPQEARLRNFTYASYATVDIHIEYIIREEVKDSSDAKTENVRIINKVIPKIKN